MKTKTVYIYVSVVFVMLLVVVSFGAGLLCETIPSYSNSESTTTVETTTEMSTTSNTETEPTTTVDYTYKLTSAEYNYLFRFVEANTSTCKDEMSKRLVCDVILNRLRASNFAHTLIGVIYQDNQFEVVTNGYINNVSATTETMQIVFEEVEHITNTDVLYFSYGRGYESTGVPIMQIGDFYFSGGR